MFGRLKASMREQAFHPGLLDLKFVQMAYLTLLVLLVTISFVYSPGTGDVEIWKRWANNADAFGIASGFKANKADYPPYSSIILLCAIRFSHLFHIEEFGGIKLFIIIFLCLISLIFWLWTKNIFITIILHFSLLLNSVALGYIDIFFAPTLILSIWAIKEQKLVFFTLFYSIACLTKWQPIIIAPFIVLYILNIKQVNQWKQVDFKNILLKVLFPAISLIIITLYVFGFIPILSSFKKALSHGFLSGNALNFNWILTHLLHVFYPERFGALIEGQADLIITRSLIITLVPKLLFFLFYTMTLVSFFRRNKTFETMINFSLIGNLAYFIFNTGVHENHLFLITILSIILFYLSRNYLFLMMVCIIISNINLFVFYGIDGRGLRFSRVIAHTMDIALLLSIFNVSFFLLLWGQTLDLTLGKNWTVTNSSCLGLNEDY